MARNSRKDLIVQDQKVDSINEFNVGMALETLGYDFEYQYFLGGRGFRGSVIIDFLVYTPLKPTPVFVHGEYWHKGVRAMEDELKIQTVNRTMRGVWNEAVIIWGEDCETQEEALAIVREKLG